MSTLSIFWLIVLIAFVIYIIYHDTKTRASEKYKSAIAAQKRPPKKLLYKRWWSWLLIVALLIFSLGSNDGSEGLDNSDKRSSTNSAVSLKNKKKEKEILQVLNMWADHNNHYGKVTIGKKNVPTLTLNDKTANSDEDKLNKIAVQFSNKVRAQRSLTKAKIGNPIVIANDGTKIATWNGSTLELTHKLTKFAKAKQKKNDLKDSQRSMSNDLDSDNALSTFVTKIIYQGDGEAEIWVSDDFMSLSNSQKTIVAKKVNSLVTSDAEDLETEADPYCFLTFTQDGSLVGHSKQFSHNNYKWKN